VDGRQLEGSLAATKQFLALRESFVAMCLLYEMNEGFAYLWIQLLIFKEKITSLMQ
jgi:hypothetical protein